jgi:hypothetical protein
MRRTDAGLRALALVVFSLLALALPGAAAARPDISRYILPPGAAAAELAAAQGPDPTAWRADATLDRINFQPGLIADTMRWTNRPTFQQVIRFNRP